MGWTDLPGRGLRAQIPYFTMMSVQVDPLSARVAAPRLYTFPPGHKGGARDESVNQTGHAEGPISRGKDRKIYARIGFHIDGSAPTQQCWPVPRRLIPNIALFAGPEIQRSGGHIPAEAFARVIAVAWNTFDVS